jgi:hypothetical protein
MEECLIHADDDERMLYEFVFIFWVFARIGWG